jgi:hypothetical protein
VILKHLPKQHRPLFEEDRFDPCGIELIGLFGAEEIDEEVKESTAGIEGVSEVRSCIGSA